MTIFICCLLALAAVLLVGLEWYAKTIYGELEFLRIENVALKLKLAELIGGEDDQA